MKTYLLVTLAGVFLATAGEAQITNPTHAVFNHTDFAITDHYVVGYFGTSSALTPQAEVTVTKPATCTPCSVPLPPANLSYGTWYAAIRAVDSMGQTSPYSTPLVAFRLCTAKGRNHC